MVNLTANPFFLDEAGVRWVDETLRSMSLEEKAGQLCFPIGMTGDLGLLRPLIEGIKPCGLMYRPGPKEEVQRTHAALQQMSKLPLLVAANLESGGSGSFDICCRAA